MSQPVCTLGVRGTGPRTSTDSRGGYHSSDGGPTSHPLGRGQRAATLSHALDFWAEQMAIEQTVLEGRENILAIRYEDLLTDSEPILRKILEHISVPADPELLNHLEGMVDSSRAYAYRGDDKLTDFAEQNSQTLQRFGY